MKSPHPAVLIILDGWGYNPSPDSNAIALARTPTWDHLAKNYPSTLVHTSGKQVGLPGGLMGNSEVGHLNIGAGRVVFQQLTHIDKSIEGGEFFRIPILLKLMQRGRESRLHLIGLLSDGGVHSHLRHLYALLRMAKENQVKEVFIHALMDGRDTPPTHGVKYLAELQQKINEYNVGKVASVSGRYYAMDRDHRWDRTKKAYGVLVPGQGIRTADPQQTLRTSYEQEITDEFVLPMIIGGSTGKPEGSIQEGDAVMFFNFRADRARQLTRALTQKDFDSFPRRNLPGSLFCVCMTEYSNKFSLPYAFGAHRMGHVLANVFAEMKIKNLRVAETEKYAHVTYFLNGGIEKAYPGEDRILVPSPKVSTYDLKPEMSAQGITDTVVKFIEEGSRDVIIVNFANADMVGHSGKLEATIKAVETIDAGLSEIYRSVKIAGGSMIITADHGNAELMQNPETGAPHTAHTTNLVPLIVVAEQAPISLRQEGALSDIAPTFLGLSNLPQPPEMNGKDLRIL